MFQERIPISGISRAAINILSTLLVVFSVPAIFMIPAEAVLFQPYSYQRALVNQHFYERFPDLMAETILKTNALPSTPGIGTNTGAYLTQDDLSKIFAMILPSSWVKSQVESTTQNFGDYINFRRTDLVLQIDMREVKAHLSGEDGKMIAHQVVVSWPACSVEQAQKIVGLVLSGQLQGIPVCRPPDVILPVFESAVHASLQGMAGLIPDQFDLAGPLTSDTPPPGITGPLVPNWWQVFRWYTVLRWLWRLTPVFALAVLLWIVLISIRSMPDLLHSSGQPLLMAGITAMVIALISIFAINPLLARAIGGAFPLLPEVFRGILTGVLNEVMNRFSIWTTFGGLVVSAVGLSLLILIRFFEQET